jgi:hypothetical protein
MDRSWLAELHGAMDKLRPFLSPDQLEIDGHDLGLTEIVNNTTTLAGVENIGKFVSKL